MTKSCILALEENPVDVYLETTSLLLKLVNNVIQDPTNPKYRSIKLSNPAVVSKLLPAAGAMECLFEMGFEEDEDKLTLPESTPLENLKYFRNEIFARRSSYEKRALKSPETSREATKETSTTAVKDSVTHMRKLPRGHFFEKIASHFQAVLRYEDKDVQRKALSLIPLKDLELRAETNMRKFQKAIKTQCIVEPEPDIQELILLELLSWFKNSFFSWVDTVECSRCNGSTKFSGQTIMSTREGGGDRIEIFICNTCGEKTSFQRYNDPKKLLQTRKGRCGEWANCFTLMCRAVGWDARFIVDETDHVWTEVFSGTRKKWLHCDPCENVCDSPLMYEAGWGKKLSYVMAYSRDEVQDVTWRYTCKHREVLSRRTECTEAELLNTIFHLRKERQKNLSQARCLYLSKRLLVELVDFLTPRQPTEAEKKGRSSGSLAWRLARGEMNVEIQKNAFVWKPSQLEIDAGVMHIQYSTAKNKYFRPVGQEELNDWEKGTFEIKSVFRKEEKDWKMTYLTRTEGSAEGSIKWKFDFKDSGMVVESMNLLFSNTVFESGEVILWIKSEHPLLSVTIPRDEGNQIFGTTQFQGCSELELNAELKGGKGDVAWQHAQLFRQSLMNNDYPFDITIRLKKLL